MGNDKFFSGLLNIPEGMNWHQAQDAKMETYPSARTYAWHYVNEVVAMNWIALEYTSPEPADEQELAACLIEIHNEAVNRLNEGVSLDRHWALVDEVRLRLRGLLTPDATLVSWPGLTRLPERPAGPRGEPAALKMRFRP